MVSYALFSVLALATSSASALCTPKNTTATACPIQFDGRIPLNSTTALFDTTASPFNTGFTKGASRFLALFYKFTIF